LILHPLCKILDIVYYLIKQALIGLLPFLFKHSWSPGYVKQWGAHSISDIDRHLSIDRLTQSFLFRPHWAAAVEKSKRYLISHTWAFFFPSSFLFSS
jgi:hypothetical protein